MKCDLPALTVIALAALGSAAGHAGEAPPAQGGSAVVIDNPLASHSLDELAATRDRPLFAPGRRPPAPPAVVVAAPPAPPPPSPPPDLALLGTIVEANGASALVRGAPSEKPSHVRVGDAVDGWSIAEIGERQIVLSPTSARLPSRCSMVDVPPGMALSRGIVYHRYLKSIRGEF